MERAMSDEMRQSLIKKGRDQLAHVVKELENEEPNMEIVRKGVLAALTQLEPVGFSLRPPEQKRNPEDVVMISRGVPEKEKPEKTEGA